MATYWNGWIAENTILSASDIQVKSEHRGIHSAAHGHCTAATAGVSKFDQNLRSENCLDRILKSLYGVVRRNTKYGEACP